MENIIKNRLIKKMELANINARDLERRSGLSLSAVTNILNGRSKNPTIETISAIANTLDCSIDELVKGITPNFPSHNTPTSSKSNIWHFPLLKEVIIFVNDYFKEIKYIPTFEQGMFFIKEIYTYSLGKEEKSLDKQFAQWLIKKNMEMP